jgi:hypothetical protein
VREAGAGHDLLQRDIVEAMPIEQSSCAVNDPLSNFHAVASGVGHKVS